MKANFSDIFFVYIQIISTHNTVCVCVCVCVCVNKKKRSYFKKKQTDNK